MRTTNTRRSLAGRVRAWLGGAGERRTPRPRAGLRMETLEARDCPAIDHPLAAAGYSPAHGALWASTGPSYRDVLQGNEGDCWLLSSLAAVASRSPATITSMFTYRGQYADRGQAVGVFDVRLFDRTHHAHQITVDTELPAGGRYYDQTSNGVLWVALAEKAYAQANGMRLVTTDHPGWDAYHALDGGEPSWALSAITGRGGADLAINPANAAAAWNAGQYVVLGSSAYHTSPYIVGSPREGVHAYAVVGYNPGSTAPFKVYNPWGADANGWVYDNADRHWVYGLFNATGSFLSHNFNDVSYTRAADAATAPVTLTAALAPPAEAAAPAAPAAPPVRAALAPPAAEAAPAVAAVAPAAPDAPPAAPTPAAPAAAFDSEFAVWVG